MPGKGTASPSFSLSADASGAKTHRFRSYYFFFPFFKQPGPLVSSLLPFPGSGAAPALPTWRTRRGRNCLGCPSSQPLHPTPAQKMPTPMAPSQRTFQQVKWAMMSSSTWLGANLHPETMPPSFHSQLLLPAAGMHQP